MYNPNDCIAVLRDAEYAAASPILNDGEKALILQSILAALPEAFNRPWIDASRSSLERLYEPYRPAQAGPTAGEQDAAQVAKGVGEATTETVTRAPEGEPEQAKDTSGVATVGGGYYTTAQAVPATQKPKQGKARK